MYTNSSETAAREAFNELGAFGGNPRIIHWYHEGASRPAPLAEDAQLIGGICLTSMDEGEKGLEPFFMQVSDPPPDAQASLEQFLATQERKLYSEPLQPAEELFWEVLNGHEMPGVIQFSEPTRTYIREGDQVFIATNSDKEQRVIVPPIRFTPIIEYASAGLYRRRVVGGAAVHMTQGDMSCSFFAALELPVAIRRIGQDIQTQRTEPGIPHPGWVTDIARFMHRDPTQQLMQAHSFVPRLLTEALPKSESFRPVPDTVPDEAEFAERQRQTVS